MLGVSVAHYRNEVAVTFRIAVGVKVRSRKLLEREAARLMGLPETYRLPASATHANNLTSDGVVVPAVTFLAAHVIEPLLGHAIAAMASKPCGASRDRVAPASASGSSPSQPDSSAPGFPPPQTAESAEKGDGRIAE
jgi:hypothetical protein